MTLTAAPGMAPLVVSCTTPVMLPRSDCAREESAHARSATAASAIAVHRRKIMRASKGSVAARMNIYESSREYSESAAYRCGGRSRVVRQLAARDACGTRSKLAHSAACAPGARQVPMPNLAANLTMTFGEVPFLDRFKAAADAGFEAVEYLFPYDYDAQVLKQQLRDHALTQVLHNLPAGDWASGERGIACLPDRVDEFQAGVDKAIGYATTLGCPRVNCLAGILPQTVDPAVARDTLVRNLAYAAPRLKAAGIALLIEPINTR